MNIKVWKETWYQNRQVDIEALAKDVEIWLGSKGYSTQFYKAEDKRLWLVKAIKKGKLRTIVAANRAFSVIFEGEPNRFYYKVGVSEWVTNVPSVVAAEVLTFGLISIPIAVSFAWAIKLRNDIKKYIKERVDFGKKTSGAEGESKSTDGNIILSPEKLKEDKLRRDLESKVAILKKARDAEALSDKELTAKIKILNEEFDAQKKLIHLDCAKANGVLSDDEYKAKVTIILDSSRMRGAGVAV